MKPKEYYIFIDDKTGKTYVVIMCPANTVVYGDMAKSIANKVFKTKKSNLVVGPAYRKGDKLEFWRSYQLDRCDNHIDRIVSYERVGNCLVVARKRGKHE